MHPSLFLAVRCAQIRVVKADDLWMSPHYGRDSLAIHFTFGNYPAQAHRCVRELEQVLAPFLARPHWGKLFLLEAPALATVLPRLADYQAYCREVDPAGVFTNAFTHRVLGVGNSASRR